MTHTILHDRVGQPMDGLKGSDGGPVAIQYGCRVNGFPDKQKLDFEYGADSSGVVCVQVTRRDAAGEVYSPKHWTLAAIADRDAKGLAGFVDFAKGIGILGHQLATAIELHHRHSNS